MDSSFFDKVKILHYLNSLNGFKKGEKCVKQ